MSAGRHSPERRSCHASPTKDDPFAPPQSEVQRPADLEDDLGLDLRADVWQQAAVPAPPNLAPRWRRVLAAVVDVALYLVPFPTFVGLIVPLFGPDGTQSGIVQLLGLGLSFMCAAAVPSRVYRFLGGNDDRAVHEVVARTWVVRAS